MKSTLLSVWTPACRTGSGEVAAFSRTFVDALEKASPASKLAVYAAADRPPEKKGAPPEGAPANSVSAGITYHGAGACPRLFRHLFFSLQLVIGALMRRPGLILLTDVRFAPTARFVKKFLRIPFAVATHHSGILRRDAGGRAMRALLDADLVLASSAYIREHLHDAVGISSEATRTLHLPYTSTTFSPGTKPPYLLSRYNLSPEQPVILTIIEPSSVSLENGYPCEQVIEALPRIREFHPDAHYLVCGELSDIDLKKVTALLRYFDLSEHVTFTASLPEDERCDHYNLASICAMPAKGIGFSVTHLESTACGTPVLAGNKDGALDTLLGGRLGILVNPDSPDEIARAVVDVLTGNHNLPLLYRPREMRKSVITNFGIDRFVRDLVTHLDHLGLDLSLQPAPRDATPDGPARSSFETSEKAEAA